MAMHYADVTVSLRVAFQDEGDLCLEDQAIEAVYDRISIPDDMLMGIERVGPVRTAEEESSFA